MKLFKTTNIEAVKITRSFLALKYPVLYAPNVSMSLNLTLQSSLALISPQYLFLIVLLNELPDYIKNIRSINKFKSKLKSYLQQNYILE